MDYFGWQTSILLPVALEISILWIIMLDYVYLKACTLARRTAETFLKYIDKNVNQLGMPLMKSRYPKNNVQGESVTL